ncbi:MAG: GH3 auxin-responsive promoter family protein [Chlorobi bacterium]|nr:GH3 auxin-responsive promoter family protein [Chlorobiota bacterium]
MIKELIAFGIKQVAQISTKQLLNQVENPNQFQQKWFRRLLKIGKQTLYGKEHNFEAIKDYDSFIQHVPLCKYENLLPYIDKIKEGHKNVLWKGLPAYFAKTSGTTAGAKYIPLTMEQLKLQIRAARQALFNYVAQTGDADLFNGKMLFLSGSPDVEKVGKIYAGRLSGIVHRHVPKWALRNRLPSYEINRIADWNKKVDAIIDEVLQVAKQLTLISGIPPWIQMFLERIVERTGKMPFQLFPNLRVYVHGGVQFAPYERVLRELLGENVVFIETFPASEGFFAFQDALDDPKKGLILLPDSGIFYEFIPFEETDNENPRRVPLDKIEKGKVYEMVLSTNAGLWAYRLGDLVRFTSVSPYRVRVVGRTSQYISAFGEHVIIEEIENALNEALKKAGGKVRDFHVAPQITPSDNERPYHEWFIEFIQLPEDMQLFVEELDKALQKQNPYYKDLREGLILDLPKIRILPQGSFHAYLDSIGKLGGQFKVPRVSNDRKHADPFSQYVLKNQ